MSDNDQAARDAEDLIELAKSHCLNGPPFGNPFDILRAAVAAALRARDAELAALRAELAKIDPDYYLIGSSISGPGARVPRG